MTASQSTDTPDPSPMDNQRSFLLIALVCVLFLIWQAWMEDQAARLPSPAAITQTPAPSATASDRPDSVPALTEQNGVAPTGRDAVLPTLPQQRILDSRNRVRVTTDQFEIEVDTLGGDLRHVGLRGYPVALDDSTPFALMDDVPSQLHVAQSGLVTQGGVAAPDHYAAYLAEHDHYSLQSGQDELVVPLIWRDDSGLEVIKRYTFRRNSFVVELEHEVRNNTDEVWRGSQYTQLQRSPPREGQSTFGVYTYTGGVVSTPEEVYSKVSFADMADSNLDLGAQGGWIAFIQHYFLTSWVPSQEATHRFYSRDAGNQRYVLGILGTPIQVAAGETASFSGQLYVGPKLQDRLEALAPNLELTVDYGYLDILARPLFWLLKYIHSNVGNWGWSIIILTIMIKLAFYKLSETSYRSMANMRKLAPEMQKLKDRYGDDRQRMSEEMMNLYRKEKINPLGGCLPILVQIPVFIALYWMLLESVELRQAPWVLWIEDLSSKDPLYILPLIMGASMFVQQKLNPPPPDPIQAKVMSFLPLVFTVFFLWFPAGLVLYWVVNNALSIAQQWVITRRIEAQAAAARA